MIKQFLTIIICLNALSLVGQKPKPYTSSEIFHAIEKLNFVGSALYIAAHPDDENTRLISYLSNDMKARTAYLSLTRGDGGQNLIGTEIQELLGVLRSQELLGARSVDGGQQFFSRAIDFGYSKHPDETLAIWNKKEVLADVVRVIRKFKPDIIVNRFDHRSPGKTHGHHTSSAMLSLEAFDLVGDAGQYPDQVSEVGTWAPSRLFFNTSWWFYGSREKFAEADKTNLMSIDIGTYYDLLGKSNTEIAAEARSNHRCQGFGSTGTRGSYTEYLEILKGDMPATKADPFEGINTTWSRVEGGDKIGQAVSALMQDYNFQDAQNSLPQLINIYKMIDALEDEHWRAIKLDEIKTIIEACAGLYLEASADQHRLTRGETTELKIEAINRSAQEMNLVSYQLNPSTLKIDVNTSLLDNEKYENFTNLEVTSDIQNTSHYWLRDQGELGIFAVKDASLIGHPNTPREYTIDFLVNILGTEINFKKDVSYKYNDPKKGEIYRPFEITDPIFVTIEEDVLIFPNEDSKKIEVIVTAGKDSIQGTVNLGLPKGWRSSPSIANYSIDDKGGKQKVAFEIMPPVGQSTGYIYPMANYLGQNYSNDLIEIDYDHIPFQTILRKEKSKVAKINLETKGEKIAYIMGAGDKVPECLEYLGYQVDVIDVALAEPTFLKNYDAVVLGIRAINTLENIDVYRDNLMAYVEQGGTFIVQYNTSRRLKSKDFAPYPMSLGRFRVSQEDAEMRITNPDHKALNYPNKITQADFNDWIQERGLYFASEWDDQYETLFSANDKGEEPGEGGTLIAKYGEGYFVYSSISWFRQLPAGVPGAYRIFANLLALSN